MLFYEKILENNLIQMTFVLSVLLLTYGTFVGS